MSSSPLNSDPALVDWEGLLESASTTRTELFSDDVKMSALLGARASDPAPIQRRLDFESITSPPSSPPAIQDMAHTQLSPIASCRSVTLPAKRKSSPREVGLEAEMEAEGVYPRPGKRQRIDDADSPMLEPRCATLHTGRQSTGAFIDDDSDSEQDEDPHNAAREAYLASGESSEEVTLPALAMNPRKSSPSSTLLFGHLKHRRLMKSCEGKSKHIIPRVRSMQPTYGQMGAARSVTKKGRAKKAYFGIEIHDLIAKAKKEIADIRPPSPILKHLTLPSIEARAHSTMLWTEKYRARRFFDLVGDDRTHRDVLRWLKGWDAIVFPGSGKIKPIVRKQDGDFAADVKPHRKILMLTGPPGLGKTTLAHVCATQAGYDVLEINASDERSSDVVKGRIRTSVGTESVKNVGSSKGKSGNNKSARPVCVVVDEVDGVVGDSGGSGEGGFIKALIDLIQVDAKNSSEGGIHVNTTRNKKKTDDFRLLRPIILICNDIYHPALRALRQSSFAEIIHIRKPPMETVSVRMKAVFEKEGITADADAVRRLCELTWGTGSGPEARFGSGIGEGDIRSVLVIGEAAASKLKSCSAGSARPRLTRRWVEANIAADGTSRGSGRGGSKEVVSRIFITGAGFSKSAIAAPAPRKSTVVDDTMPRTQLHAAEIAKKAGMERLREMIDTAGETDRIMTDVFAAYPSHHFHDDSIMSKPDAAYEWMHFSDLCSTKVWSDQDWELMPYLSQPILACHHLFAAPAKSYQGVTKWNDQAEDDHVIPFSGPRADYDAKEAEKQSRATLSELQGSLSARLLRTFRSPEAIATDFVPYLIRMLSPDVKPVVVGGSGEARGIASVRKEGEKEMVRRAVDVMSDIGVRYERGKLEGSRGTEWVYRLEPPLDDLTYYATAQTATSSTAALPVRYAIRQVLDQEHARNLVRRENAARQQRFTAGNINGDNSSYVVSATSGMNTRIVGLVVPTDVSVVKRDFFGRVLREVSGNSGGLGNSRTGALASGAQKRANKVWVTFHEGYSNAVRKPVTVEELLRGL